MELMRSIDVRKETTFLKEKKGDNLCVLRLVVVITFQLLGRSSSCLIKADKKKRDISCEITYIWIEFR